MVLSRIAVPADPGRTVARRPHGADCVVPVRTGCGTVRPTTSVGSVRLFMGTIFERLGRISCVHRGNSVFDSRLPLAEAPNSLAAAQPADRHLCLHWRDPRGLAGCNGGILLVP